MKHLRLLPALLLLLASGLGVSCVDHAYDFQNTDTDAVIASDGISVPLGSTKQMTVESLFGKSLGDAVSKKADGSYLIHYDANTFSADISGLNNIEANLPIGDASNPINAIVWLFDKPAVDLSLYPEERVDLSDYMDLSGKLRNHVETIHVAISDIPKEIAAIKNMTLAPGATLKVSVSIPDCLLTEGTISPDVKIDLGELLNLSGIADNVLKINDIVLSPENNYFAQVSYPVQSILFDPDDFDAEAHSLGLNADIKVSGSYVIQQPATTKERYLESPYDNSLVVAFEVTGASIATVTGSFDYKTSQVKYSYNLGDFAGKLGSDDAVLDFANPSILLDIQGMLGIPVNAHLTIVGLKKGATVGPEPKDMLIELPVAKDGSISKKVTIAKNGDIPYDLSALLRANPDAIEFRIYAETDKTKSGTISKEGKYSLDLTPHIDIPLAFGPELRLNFRDTVAIPPTVGSLLKNNTLKLSGDAIHTLPLSLRFGFVMTDDAGNAITSPANTPDITAGQKTSFELSQSASSPSAAERISKAILTFNLSASDYGVALNANQTIQLDNLKIALPDGYHLSLQ